MSSLVLPLRTNSSTLPRSHVTAPKKKAQKMALTEFFADACEYHSVTTF